MRSIWKGAISFGLVNIPVRLYSASMTRELKFKLLHNKDLSEIRYARICKTDGKEIPWEDIVKGYENEDGSYVILTEEDFKSISLEKSRTLEIIDFAEEREIDPIYYDTPYYLEPEKSALKAYSLLCEALKKSKKVAIGYFVFHNHEHIGVIRPQGNLMILHQLRYNSEIRDEKDLNLPKKNPLSQKEMSIALKLIDELTKPFNPKDYADTYTEEVKALIEKKAKGKKVKVAKSAKVKSTKTQNILSLLESSLKEGRKKHRKAA